MTLALILLLALAIDRWLGEPPAPLHPVVWIGQYLKVVGAVTTRCAPALAFVLGALGWLAGALAVGAAAWLLQGWLLNLIAAKAPGGAALAAPGLLLAAWLLKTLLAWAMLRDEAGAVESALGESLDAGRDRLSRLVSRDTAALGASEVRESAIESLAENLNDSVIAPIFWFVLFGLPGAAVYRFANTADAMWGYRGSYRGRDWEWAGKWAARADDLLSWLPARLTALLLALVSRPALLRQLRPEAIKTPSPNSGWPMAAMALALGVRLRKPGVYGLNPDGRAPQPGDSALAQRHAGRAVALAAALAVLTLVVAVRP